MNIAPWPEDKSSHLAELQRDGIPDTSPEGVFDDVTHVIAQICGISITLVSFVEADRQWSNTIAAVKEPGKPCDTTRDDQNPIIGKLVE